MHDLPKAYTASEHEKTIYALWESKGSFAPRAKKATDTRDDHFSLVTPPPNANGNLHMGHALTFALEDLMVRYHRMRGHRTLMIPGMDHAGFETQVVFEKILEKEGRSRFQMTREQFYAEALAFTLANKGNAEAQMRMLGASCYWDANLFTLDDKVVDRVYKTFRRMYDDGLIYRGERIVNFSVKYQTAYSDIEVIHEDRVDPLYYIKYGPITVATVRPETKFGEKVIVVHPDDVRYQKYIGKTFKATIATGEELDMTVIADDIIKPEFGTGAMTITPAHDPIDFEIAQRHNLPIIPIINTQGRMLPIAGEFAGMKVAEARKAVAAKMQELGLIEKIDPNYKHSVALCYKSMQPIEPMVMPQWYVKVRPLADAVSKAIQSGEVQYFPESFSKIQMDWLEGLRDWNISRQIWWGIPINGAVPEKEEIANDPDTFDTWFSSSQWPYVVLEAMGDGYLEDFYPTSVMETGRDLIFSWVTRMLMMGIYLQSDSLETLSENLQAKIPFKNVYFHGMVLDKHGKKMSKSKGNVVSPVELVAKYGADAVRFGLLVGASAGSDIPMPEEKIVGGRNFANKLWNMARFVEMNSPTGAVAFTGAETVADTAMLTALDEAVSEVTEHIEKFRLAQALQKVHEVAWQQFADIYVEAAKTQLNADATMTEKTVGMLQHCMLTLLKLAHPAMPFVTEAIWQQISYRPADESELITSQWPVK